MTKIHVAVEGVVVLGGLKLVKFKVLSHVQQQLDSKGGLYFWAANPCSQTFKHRHFRQLKRGERADIYPFPSPLFHKVSIKRLRVKIVHVCHYEGFKTP